MSPRLADPAAMRTRSPIFHDDSPKRPPPSPSNKAPPPKKLDVKSRAVSEEPCLPPKALQPPPPSDPHPEPCMDKPLSSRVVVNREIFDQILELDDEEDHDFSIGMVEDYLNQAQSTIKLMDDTFAKRDLALLGKHGHFLKGSSAALGVVQVQEICEKIQHLGSCIDADKEPEAKIPISVEDAFTKIKPLLVRLKDEYMAAANWFKNNGFDP